MLKTHFEKNYFFVNKIASAKEKAPEHKVKKVIKIYYFVYNSFHKVLHKSKFLYLIIPKQNRLSI